LFKRFEDSVFGTGKISAMISSRSILLYTIIATGPPTGRDATVMKSTSGTHVLKGVSGEWHLFAAT
jgi:hypothetical protein